MTFAKSERAQLCDLFEQVGPDAPTLCEGWTTHDLAVHLWIRETDPLGASGLVAKPLAGLLERRTGEVKQRWSYAEIVDRVRNGPARFSVFSIPGVDEPANTTEFFVHHEDVRRAGEHPQPARDLGTDVEEWMWRRLKLLGRAFFRRALVGVVLERAAGAESGESGGLGSPPDPETIRAAAGSSIVTVIGLPSELMLYGHGRRSVAQVKVVGESAAIDLLEGTAFDV